MLLEAANGLGPHPVVLLCNFTPRFCNHKHRRHNFHRCTITIAGADWDGSERAAVVASSASGWIARILLATNGPPYGGKVYHGAKRVHTLVTLGTPHISSEPVTMRNISWVNTHYPGCSEAGVRWVGARGRRLGLHHMS